MNDELMKGRPEGEVFCPVCHRRRPAAVELEPCEECGYRAAPRSAPPLPRAPRAPAAPRPHAAESVVRLVGKTADSVRGRGAERLIGEKLLNYVGTLLLVLGGAFFLKYTWGFSGPWGKLAIGLGSGASLILAGERLRRAPGFELFSIPLTGGGWILAYYTVFAAHWLPAARVVESPLVGLGLLCAAAAGMIAHSLAVRSRLLTSFAFGSAYFAFAVTHLGPQSLTVCTVLALAGAILLRELKYPELAAVNLAGFYANYYPTFRLALAGSGGHSGLAPADFWYGLGVATAVHAAYALAAPARAEDGAAEPDSDAVLSLGSVLYASLFYAQATSFDVSWHASALLALAAVLTGLSAARGRSEKRSALEAVQAFLAFAVAALAVFKLPGFSDQLWGLALAASVFGTLGLWLDRKSFEGYGLAFAGLWGLAALSAWPGFALERLMSGGAALYLGLTGYALAALRQSHGRKSLGVTGAWLYAGLCAVLLAFWVWLEPAAFVLAAMSWALALEWAAESFGAEALSGQALIVELSAGLYSFAIDYGANLPIAGPLTPRLAVTAALTAAFAWLSLASPPPSGSLLGVTGRDWRKASAWLMTAIAAFGIYLEFSPRLRLPLWALSALALLWRGRADDEVAPHLRAQAYLLTMGTAAEGVMSYLYYPTALMPRLGRAETAVYAGSALLLLAPVFWPTWARGEADRSEELGSAYLFSVLSLGLLALLVGKEADGAYITLGLTLMGFAYMLLGLLAGRKSLRLPGLSLLGFCALKALFVDMTGLALPQRVLSYTVMGGLMVLSSYLYVQRAKEEDADAA